MTLLSINIVSDYPMWMMLLCILLGMFYAAALYFKNKELNEFKKWQVYTLFGLRFVAVSIIAFLLMNPFIKTIFNATEKPLIIDRKSTRLNSSHVKISYAVFCLKKKKKK